MIRTIVLTVVAALLDPTLGRAEIPETLPVHPRQIEFEASRQNLPTVDGRRYQLSSGAIVYVVEDHSLPLVEIGLATRAGSFLEPPEKVGLATLTATQLRRGGTSSLGPEEFDDRVDDLGALMDSKAGGTRAGATLSVPTWSFPEALEIFFDMISEPKFDASRLENAQSSYLEGLTRRNENSLEVLEREWSWLVYGRDHFTTRPWTPNTLHAIDRSTMVEFHQIFWRPQNMIMAVSGDVITDDLLERLDDHFSAWPEAAVDWTPANWPPQPPGKGVDPGLYHYEFDVPQAKVILGHRLSHPLGWHDSDRFALAVVEEILGGKGAISRIGGRLRTAEGLVYRVGLNIDPGEYWPGELQIFFETRSDAVTRAVQLTVEEVERLRSEAPHPTELAVAKRLLISRLGMQFDTAEEIAGYFAGDEFVARPHSYWQSYIDAVDTVTPEQVRVAANKYLNTERLICLVVGRWSEISTVVSGETSVLETKFGSPVRHLPMRDPSTLEPLVPETGSKLGQGDPS